MSLLSGLLKKKELFDKKNEQRQIQSTESKVQKLEADLLNKKRLNDARNREADLKSQIAKVTPESKLKKGLKYAQGALKTMKANTARNDQRTKLTASSKSVFNTGSTMNPFSNDKAEKVVASQPQKITIKVVAPPPKAEIKKELPKSPFER